MIIKLDTRLQTSLDQIANNSKMADIGCDHGKLSVSALLSGKASSVIAVDISPASLKKTEILAERVGVQVQCRVGDGLSVIKQGEVDTVVIAGMGANEIVKILENAPCHFDKYILTPHQHTHALRKYLVEKGAGILRDITVKEGKHFYSVIVASFGKPSVCTNLWIGEKSAITDEYVKMRLKKVNDLLLLGESRALREEKEVLEKYDKS